MDNGHYDLRCTRKSEIINYAITPVSQAPYKNVPTFLDLLDYPCYIKGINYIRKNTNHYIVSFVKYTKTR